MAKKEKVRSSLTLTHELLGEYDIILDENQFALTKRGSTAAVGYYSTLGGALRKVARLQVIQQTHQDSLKLEEFLEEYNNINNKLIKEFSL